TVGSQSSNGVTFTVGTGTISGTVTSNGTAVSSALVEGLQSNVTQGSATTATNGTYSIPNLNPGTYDMRITASSYRTLILAGNSVAAGATTTINPSLKSSNTISDRITQSDGVTPVSGATITTLQGTASEGTATTNSSGN